jgi:hypothetical protein
MVRLRPSDAKWERDLSKTFITHLLWFTQASTGSNVGKVKEANVGVLMC